MAEALDGREVMAPRREGRVNLETIAVAALIPAAGTSSRVGRPKALAELRGRPLLQWVLDLAHEAGFAQTVVVLGDEAETIRERMTWRGETIVRNPEPEAGLAGSVRLGIEALSPAMSAAVILLGDQPLTRPDVVEALVARLRPDGPPVVVPRYEGGGGANPVAIRRDAWWLAGEMRGDRGLGPLIRLHPELVEEIAVSGANPDVDTPEELAALEARLAARE